MRAWSGTGESFARHPEMSEDGRISLAAYCALYPADGVAEFGGVTCLRLPGAPDSPMLNRVVGLGVDTPATEAELDEAIAFMGDVTFYVSLEPHAQGNGIQVWLEERGFAPGWGWMRFGRDARSAPDVTTTLEIRQVGVDDSAAFAMIQRSAYGLPETADAALRSVSTAPGWSCWIGFAGDEPAAAGALYVQGGSAYFGLGATLPQHRGNGGQSAIFATRIEHARSLGCTRLLTETGERRDEMPGNSYRNITRFGFEERDVLQNWVRNRSA